MVLMKPLFPFLSVLLLIPCADSQEVVTGPFVIRENVIYHENTNEPVTGTVEEFYENGQLKERRNYRDGVREGAWEHFYLNGQLWGRGKLKDGKPEGFSEVFYDHG